MKNIILTALVLTILSLNVTFANDGMDYIPTPTANQIADLQDADDDGVINARDLCTGTPIAAEVDNDGCETYVNKKEQYQLKILFDNDSSRIKSVFQRKGTELAAFLNKYPETSIEIQGYASKVGDTKYNYDLARRRAENVRNLLIEKGIDSQRLKIVSYGDTHLAALGLDEVSHALNRRVTATVIGHKGIVKNEWTIFTTIPKVN